MFLSSLREGVLTMKTIVLIVSVIVLVLITGCEANQIPPSQQVSSSVIEPKTVTISGIDQKEAITDSQPVKLIISGTGNEITVTEGTNVAEIVLSGSGNKIVLPAGSVPEITQSGVNNQIIYS